MVGASRRAEARCTLNTEKALSEALRESSEAAAAPSKVSRKLSFQKRPVPCHAMRCSCVVTVFWERVAGNIHREQF